MIEIGKKKGISEDADRLSGKYGTGKECYPGTDNLSLCSPHLLEDYNIHAAIGYVATGNNDVPNPL